MHWDDCEIEKRNNWPEPPPGAHQRECLLNHREYACSIRKRRASYPSDGPLNRQAILSTECGKEGHECNRIHDCPECLVEEKLLRSIDLVKGARPILFCNVSWEGFLEVLLPKKVRRAGEERKEDELAQCNEVQREGFLQTDQQSPLCRTRRADSFLICFNSLRQQV